MAAEWVSNGSYKDLSDMPLAKTSLWPTSQAAGNMTSTSEQAMTAPGSPPVDPLPDRDHQGDPSVKLGAEMATGTSGKPQASRETSYTPAPARWRRTTVPDVVRAQPVNVPGAETST